MNPGKLNRRIILQVRTLTKDATGSRVQTWADLAPVWAEQVKQTGKEASSADAENHQDTRQFRIRHRAINEQDHRILYQSKFFNITGIIEEGIKTTLLLDVSATKPGGVA
jgi:SPP1 family predicted phage head-tail adaptor